MGMVNKEEFEKWVESRLVKMGSGYYRFYPDPDETWINVVLIMSAIQLIGYSFVIIGVQNGWWFMLFEKKGE